MDQSGVFERNRANPGAKDETGVLLYAGPVEYPKMMYHPEGKSRVLVPEAEYSTPFGPKKVAAQTEVIWELANSPEEEERLRKEGWHDTPAKAIVAGGGVAPPMGPVEQVRDLKTENEQLKRQLLAMSKKAGAS
jgi:hypothetical protein